MGFPREVACRDMHPRAAGPGVLSRQTQIPHGSTDRDHAPRQASGPTTASRMVERPHLCVLGVRTLSQCSYDCNAAPSPGVRYRGTAWLRGNNRLSEGASSGPGQIGIQLRDVSET